MKRISMTDFSGGMVQAINPEHVPDNAFEDIINYEYRGTDGLSIRLGQEEYEKLIGITDDKGASVNPATSIAVWYPSRMPSDAKDGEDKIFLIQSGEQVVAYYETDSGWSKTVLLTGSDAKAQYYLSPRKAIIADGHNPIIQVRITVAGIMMYGAVGIPAPINPIVVSDAGEDQLYVDYETTDKGMAIEKGNILQYCYTVEDKYGSESNPSPITTETRMMWKHKDEDNPDGGFKYYWYRTKISGMSASQYSDTIRDSLEYYNIYRRDIEFLEGTAATSFVLVYRVHISSYTEDGVYIDSSAESLQDISYLNEVAPVASKIAGVNNVIFAVAPSDTDIIFPFSFDEYLDIGVENPNSIDYITPVIALKIPWIVAGSYDISGYLYDIPDNIDKIRLYFEDFTTPCPVIYYESGEALYIFARLPHLDMARVTHLYLCMAGAAAGVTDSRLQTYSAGRFERYSMVAAQQYVFTTPQVQGVSQSILSYYPGDWYWADDETIAPNKADGERSGELSIGRTVELQSNAAFYHVKLLGDSVTFRTIYKTMCPSAVASNYGGDITFAATTQNNFLALYAFTYRGIATNIGSGYFNILRIYDSILGYTGIMMKVETNWLGFVSSSGSVPAPTDPNYDLRILPEELGLATFSIAMPRLQIALMWQDDAIYAMVHCGAQSVVKKVVDTVLASHMIDPGGASADVELIVQYPTDTERIIETLALDYRTNTTTYQEDEAEDVLRSFECGIPYYRSQVGAKPWLAAEDWDNGAVTIEHKVLDNDLGSHSSLRWSDSNGNVFPALNYANFREPILAVAPVPSFLKTEYQNTIVVMTRNTISRIILSDDLSQMGARADNLVEQFTQGGLYAPDSLCVTPYGLVWLSESGVMLWSDSGMQNISSGILDLDYIGRPNDFVGAFYSVNSQYILCDTASSDQTCYVYHFGRSAWTRFTGMKFLCSSALDLGSDTHNTLLLGSTAGIYEYPRADSSEAVTGSLVSKKYRLDNIKPVRFRMLWDVANDPDSIYLSTYNNEFGATVTEEYDPLTGMRFKWLMIPIGLWGEYLQFTINNIRKLTRIEVDLKEGI